MASKLAAVVLLAVLLLPAAGSAQSPVDAATLGGARSVWIASRGEPSRGVLGDRFGNIDVMWRSDMDGQQRASHVELVYERARPVADARRDAEAYQPADAQPVRTYTARAGQTVEVFISPLLAASFPAEQFGDEEPGTFIRIAQRGSNTTTRVVLGIGNNP